MTITKDPETGLFWDEKPGPVIRSSFKESDIWQEGLNIIERFIAVKREWDAYVDKVEGCVALGFEPGLPIEKLVGSFAEASWDTFKDKIKEK